jgi:hypothetical protein
VLPWRGGAAVALLRVSTPSSALPLACSVATSATHPVANLDQHVPAITKVLFFPAALLDAKFQQFAVDAGGTPKLIFRGSVAASVWELAVGQTGRPNFPGLEQPESLTMSANDGFQLDHGKEDRSPPCCLCPPLAPSDPEDPVQGGPAGSPECRAFLRGRHLNFRLNSSMYDFRKKALAPSALVIPASRSSCGNRPCQVPKLRSERPRAVANTPQSLLSPVPSSPVPPASGRCTRHRTSPAFQSPRKLAITVRVDSSSTSYA